MPSTRSPRRVIRCAPFFVGLVCLASAVFVTGFAWSVVSDGVSLTTAVFFILSAMGLLGVFQVFTTSIRLDDDLLLITDGWRRRSYPRSSIQRVTWAKGCPASIEVEGLGWLDLPETGRGTQGVANSIRAWVKRGEASQGTRRAAEREDAADEGAGT